MEPDGCRGLDIRFGGVFWTNALIMSTQNSHTEYGSIFTI